ncbi:MAG: polysaccharide biosynthesis/export family protein [Thermoguttaceae bacterium]|jgi:polysaccharide export outer membrane protein
MRSPACRGILTFSGLLTLVALLAGNGCQSIGRHETLQPAGAQDGRRVMVPRELSKVVLPPYVIEPPDILAIDAIHIAPRTPYHLRTFDVLAIQVQGTLPDQPIAGYFHLQPGGLVQLGHDYGAVNVAGLTAEEAQEAVRRHLLFRLREPMVSLTLADTAAKQQIAGQHLVGPDGTVTLGGYGSVLVVGMTIAQAKQAIEQHLSQHLENPEVAVDVFAYNSKVYYIVTQGAGLGDGVYRFPIKGNETVLDAISEINGMQAVSSKKIWVARPTDEPGKTQNLPVNWEEITADANACTNYQLLPGDRVFVQEDKLIALDTGLAKIIAPMERVMGFSLLGVGTVTRFSGPVLKGGGNRQGTF